ncbi:MAG: beta-ketoacyl-[acyl-carrier-protein] synthase family protein [Balneolaceae bacterium]|nr:beta-ketoacyl-[acyl-carrier-protein] synthase family protein [Balneolaceae bacterium]
MNNRVVITGLGVVSPNGTGIKEFQTSIRTGKSGVKHDASLQELNFQCQVSAKPTYDEAKLKEILPAGLYIKLENEAMKYACLAGHEAWLDSGLPFTSKDDNPDWDTGIIFGVGALAMDEFIGGKFEILQSGNPRKIGSRVVEQTMNSGAVTYLNKMIGFGNIATANSSACATGTEAVILGYERIKNGKAKRMLCGSTESQGVFIWSGFEALRIICSDSNDAPEKASRPLAANPAGFVPGTGSGALVLESLDSALERGAKIYGEIVAGDIVNGGQRNGGSITANSPAATQRVMKTTMAEAGITGDEVDLICGHLTSTIGDVREIEAWTAALERSGSDFPRINALKSMIGHCLGASGSIEMVAATLQLHHQFAHPNINIDNLHPDIVSKVDATSISFTNLEMPINYLMKASLGFGDVNSCIVLKKWDANE